MNIGVEKQLTKQQKYLDILTNKSYYITNISYIERTFNNMANSFQELKNSRKENLAKLQAELAKMASGGQKFVKESDDERFWQPTANKDGTGSAVIRFLPAPKGEQSAIVRVFSHGFEGPHGWYIEKSRSTLTDSQGNQLPDPVAVMNRKLWGMGENSDGRAFVSGNPAANIPGSKRKLKYYTNVYVVKDPGNKANEGTVRLYTFGARIHDKIVLASTPKHDDVEAFDPFDLIGGANFKLKFSPNEKGFRQYTESTWDLVSNDNDAISRPRGALFKDEDKLEKIWLQAHPLFPYVDPNSFKSYNDLNERLTRIMGNKFADVLGTKVVNEETVQAKADTELPPWDEKTTSEASEETSEDELKWFRDLRDKVNA